MAQESKASRSAAGNSRAHIAAGHSSGSAATRGDAARPETAGGKVGAGRTLRGEVGGVWETVRFVSSQIVFQKHLQAKETEPGVLDSGI